MATSSNGGFPATLPILDGKNYDKWCNKMRVILGFQDCLYVVTIELEKLSEKADEPQPKEGKKRDYKV